MAKTQVELDQERARLLERITAQRASLVRDLEPVRRVEHLGQRVSALVADALGYIGGRPLAVMAAVAGLLVVRPRTALRLLGRGLALWRGWRTVQKWQPGLVWKLVRRFI
jgi:hypothetical protein